MKKIFGFSLLGAALLTLIVIRGTALRWQKILSDGELYYGFTYAGGRVYTGNANGTVYAFHAASGKELWHTQEDHAISSAIVVYGTSVVFTTEDGTVFMLNGATGKEKWRYTPDDPYRFATPPQILGDRLYIADLRGSLYSINPENGTLRWKFMRPAAGAHDNWTASLVMGNGAVLYSGIDGSVYSVSTQKGHTNWSFAAGAVFTAPLVMAGDRLYAGTANGDVIALSARTGQLLWRAKGSSPVLSLRPYGISTVAAFGDGTVRQFATDGKNRWEARLEPATASLVIRGATVYIAGAKGKLYALDAATGKVSWQQDTQGTISAGPLPMYRFPIPFDRDILIGNANGTLVAYGAATGKERWRASCPGRPVGKPVAIMNVLVYACSDGGIYTSPFWKLPGRSAQLTVTQQTVSFPTFTVLELTLRRDDSEYTNPFDDVTVTALFHQDGRKDIEVDGFYYGKDTWKVRFNPPGKGTWSWTVRLADRTGTSTSGGTYTSKTDSSLAYLHATQTNPARLTQDGTTIFNGTGINNAVIDFNHNGNPLDDWYIGDERPVSLDTFARTYASGGIGLYRWGIDNASFGLTDAYTIRTKILLSEAMHADKLLATLKQNGFHIWLTLFGFSVPLHDLNNPNEQRALKTYIRYVMARYGAYVSIWEIANEAFAADPVVDMVARQIHAADFENRPVSMSWDHERLASLTIHAPHAYLPQNTATADTDITSIIDTYIPYGKPVFFGEVGNSDKNWGPNSALIMRVRNWAAFMNGATLTFWNQSDKKNYYNPVLKNANLYIGPEEREFTKHFREFTAGIPLDSRPFAVRPSNASVRAYGLSSSKEVVAYFYHYANPFAPTTTAVSIGLPRAATVRWYNPEKGTYGQPRQYGPGTYQLDSPTFSADVALKIAYNTAAQ